MCVFTNKHMLKLTKHTHTRTKTDVSIFKTAHSKVYVRHNLIMTSSRPYYDVPKKRPSVSHTQVLRVPHSTKTNKKKTVNIVVVYDTAVSFILSWLNIDFNESYEIIVTKVICIFKFATSPLALRFPKYYDGFGFHPNEMQLNINN